MKFQDPNWTNRGESDVLIRILRSRTKAGVSKVIRYRCSSSSKLCRQELRNSFGSKRNLKCSGSGDSMLARVKIKEIDGATPQGVDCAA